MSAVSDANFSKVLEGGQSVVMFWQRECAPCKALVPTLVEVARERPSIRFVLMNSADNPRTAAQYEITVCPTMVAFAHGRKLGQWKGAAPKEQVIRWIDRTYA